MNNIFFINCTGKSGSKTLEKSFTPFGKTYHFHRLTKEHIKMIKNDKKKSVYIYRCF